MNQLQNNTPVVALEKSFSELPFNPIVDAYKEVWKKTDPDSYAVNRAIYAVAPYCGPEVSGWLNLGALLTFCYGFKQITDNPNRRDH